MFRDDDRATQVAAEARTISSDVPGRGPHARTKMIEPMMPLRLGGAERGLFGILHQPEPTRASATCVLMCNPFGQEAVRSHRLFRVLAERLARAGHHVLRFDYHGTGDSAGNDGDGDLDGWQADIALAHQELIARSGCVRVVWVGARLGATLALSASHQVMRRPDALLAWEPLLDGAAYLDDLAHHHAQALRTTYSILPRGIELHPDDEAMGFALTPRLREQMRTIDMSALLRASAGARVLVSTSAALRKVPSHESIRQVVFDHTFDWASEEAIYTSPLVPPDALRMLLDQIGALA